MWSHSFKLGFVSLALAFLFGCTGTGKYAPDPDPISIKIGFIYNMEGFDQYPIEQGVRCAIAEINAAGGVNGQKLELIVNSDRPDSVSGLPGTQALLSQGVVAIVGGPTSGLHMQMVQLTAPAGVPLVSQSATSPLLSNLNVGGHNISGSLSWRVPPSDALQGKVLAQQVSALSVSTVGIIYRQDAYGTGLHDAFRSNYSGTISSDVLYAACKTSGFTTEVQTLLGNPPPEAILIIGLQLDSAAITWELQAQLQAFPAGSRPHHYFGVDGVYVATFAQNAAPSIIEGMYGTVPTHPDSPDWDHFAQLYTSHVGQDPTVSYAAQSYDATYLIALAMARGQANTSAAIVANLGSVSRPSGSSGDVIIHPGEFTKAVQAIRLGQSINYEGASGSIDLDVNGDPTSATYAWWQIQDGAFVTLGTVHVP